MSSNMMSCTEPVPSGTWQSSVLISVKLLMFQGDVVFLARICSYQCDIYLTCGHFGLKWHPPRNFVHPPKNCGPIQVFFPTRGKGCLTLPLLQRISKQRSPQMKKGVAFDSLVRRHSFCFPCFARVCMLYLIYKYGISYVHFSVRFV